MTVLVKIPTQLPAVAGGESEAEVDGATVQEVLDGLFERFEELRARIADDDGSLRRFVNVYVAGEDIRFLDGSPRPSPTAPSLRFSPQWPAARTPTTGFAGGAGGARRRPRSLACLARHAPCVLASLAQRRPRGAWSFPRSRRGVRGQRERDRTSIEIRPLQQEQAAGLA